MKNQRERIIQLKADSLLICKIQYKAVSRNIQYSQDPYFKNDLD
ncbi:MAG TPA: hypothetical protein PL048_22505 [Leptospiraceae bacterium]|nr:hypothetical protein [Leptospiraceae bacterium]HMY69334.1 hypothetical protein [Leptospiraceae bacterium]HMZ61561.1 hypothetical protein [Leptospiraceae bacterium]HNF14336.1 hypothetical protein [Leptospiraceae bacterium]HNF23388.1 hypothetical protein [Leptospiraceae bacterium]